MSTTSSSRADRRGLAAVLALGLLTACTSPRPAPEAPRPGPAADGHPTPGSKLDQPLSVREATIRPLDPSHAALAGAAFLEAATDPLQVEVRLAEALEPVLSTSSPIIVLNGRRLTDTRVHPKRPDHLIAFLPDRRELKEANAVQAEWLDRADTRSNEVRASLP